VSYVWAPSPPADVAPGPAPDVPAGERGRERTPWAALLALVGAATLYHALQSLGHVTPAVFTDELLYSKLSQSLAAGEGFALRGEQFGFPAPLAPLVQAPAWLAGNLSTGYEIAKALNALVMASAALPAYWLAHQLVSRRSALLVAAAAVVAPAMIYHAYLLSEALAYPVFLIAVAVYVRELTQPTAAAGAAVIAVSALAVGTRTQFVALPVAYLVAAISTRGGELRRHAVPLVGLVVLAVAALLAGSAFGPYLGAALGEYSSGEVARWSGLTAALLPFEAGWAVLPGALVGLAWLAVRGCGADRPFAALTLSLVVLVLVQAGLVAALQADRPLGRYAIYLTPLVILACVIWAERGGPWAHAVLGVSLAAGVAAWLVPFPSLADYRFSFDSPVLSAYGTLTDWLGNANAATIFAAVPCAVAFAVGVLRRRPLAGPAIALALLAAIGAVAYAGDRAMTRRSLETFAAQDPSWLDESGAGRADVLVLPGASYHFAWMLEAWNRSSGGLLQLWVPPPPDAGLPARRAIVARDGTLLEDGEPREAGLLVVADYGTRLELEGEILARPRPGLTLVRTGDAPKVHSAALGLFADGWASQSLRYRVFPEAIGGRYLVELALPETSKSRAITLRSGESSKTVRLSPGHAIRAELPAAGELELTSDRIDYQNGDTPNPRVVIAKVVRLAYVGPGTSE
jgi:hypothetical protein